MSPVSKRFAVIGDQSLTIACAAELLERSHQIVGLVTDASPVRMWATENNVSVVTREQLSQLRPFDYLLSIANLRLLTADELALPAKAAINFHDGPLPDVSGVNNPSWAVLQRLTGYGVTWHEMVSEVDHGDVLESEQFELEADETSVSLNTRCFHAGFRSFQKLLDQMETGSLRRTAQSDTAERRYYSRWKRPNAACSLPWNSSAGCIDGLVRSLEFGPYENPMGTPKIRLPTGLAAVGKMAILPDRSVREPGTIIAVANNWARIATATHDVRISKLCGLSGTPIPMAGDRVRLTADCGLEAGHVLPGMADGEADELDDRVRRSAREESQWVAQLEGFAVPDLPQSGSDEVLEDSVELPSALQEPAAALGLVAAYLGRSFQSDRIDFWVHRDTDERQCFEDYFLGCVPFSVRPDWEGTADDLLNTVRQDLEATLKRAPPLVDIGLRYPSLHDKLEQIAELPSCEFSLSSGSRQDAPGPGARRLVFTMSDAADGLRISSTGIFEPGTFAGFVERFRIMLKNLGKDPTSSIAACPTLTNDDRDLLKRLNDTRTDFDVQTVHALFRKQAQASPDRDAVIGGDKLLTYQQLDQESDQMAMALSANGVGPGDLVGVMMSRSAELLAVLMGVIKAGAAYVPLDRNYPPNRLQFIIADCRPKMIVVDHAPAWSSDAVQMVQCTDLSRHPGRDVSVPASCKPSDLMYVIYTSGSTGKPKGVQVRHDNVHNFFVGMDERIGPDAGTLLATTSISFDISVLELFWTLCRGFTVVLHDEDADGVNTRLPGQPIGFSLFFWNIAETKPLEGSPYNLVLQASKYADTNDFEAVWTPERHFGSFGGYYPNPSVISAAIAATTRRVAIRAGSCVLPLHHPVRVAEEWSVVDNLSGGRVGLSMAAGWSPNDFVLKPENFANAKDLMFESIEQVRALWRGDSVTFTGPKGAVDVKSLPRPVQQELSIWVTAAGNPDTFRQAGEIGAHILTHLLGQNIDKVAEKIEIYRNAWRASGRPGDGHVTVMVHTFVAASEQDARRICREPMMNYLKSALALIKDAAWQFPTFQKFSAEGERTIDDFFANADPQDVDGLLEFAFERYYNNNSMLGSVEKCVEFADTLKEAGVDEIGCLIDFGIDESTVMKHLPFLNEVRTASNADEQETPSVSQAIVRHGVTHLQCTPSRATMILHESEAAAALNNLSCLMVGGEPLSKELVHQLQGLTQAPLFNMYGPTETTIWSSMCNITTPDDANLIGTPLANQTAYVLDPRGAVVPPGVVGELAIGGLGVTSGYLGQPALNQDRFIKMPGVDHRPVDVYKTGDLVRLMDDGRLEFLGRGDSQVKVRGFRIELGEIEACMQRLPEVVAAAAVVQHANTPNAVIVGFHVSTTGDNLSDDLSAELKTQLPDFMIPAHFVAVPHLPCLPNGKLDRQQLEQTQVTREKRSDAVPPSTETECALARIWGSLLNVEVVSKTDNFFELGGHSLLAIQAIDAIEKQMNVRLNPRKILTNTLEQLARDCASIPQPGPKSRAGAFGRFFGRRS